MCVVVTFAHVWNDMRRVPTTDPVAQLKNGIYIVNHVGVAHTVTICIDVSFSRGMLSDVHTSQLRQSWTCLCHVHDYTINTHARIHLSVRNLWKCTVLTDVIVSMELATKIMRELACMSHEVPCFLT